jgi:imidazole glycerol-phosphate synthase subunit HisH
MTRIHLCDYGIGNIHNVQRALSHAGGEVVMCTTPQALDGATALVIPGVGAFGDCITRFRAAGFEPKVRDLIARNVPLLGICVGMQMLATGSEEHGAHAGLDLIPGRVRRLPEMDSEGATLKLPHIAWSRLHPAGAGWSGSPLEGLPDGAYGYFVHSYSFDCDDPAHELAACSYGGHRVTAAVRCDRIFGTQFHPEKSAETGLTILRRFLEIAAR